MQVKLDFLKSETSSEKDIYTKYKIVEMYNITFVEKKKKKKLFGEK